MRVLYISYDGLMEPLGQSQVFQYLKYLARRHEIILVTFEKKQDWLEVRRRRALAKEVRQAGIDWLPLRYHKRPAALATAFDVAVGLALCTYLLVRRRIQIVHARSYVPAVIALILQRAFRVKFLFDMRGFWADERVDAGNWSRSSLMYRAAKWFERRFLIRADVVVSLTRAAARLMRAFPYLTDRSPRIEVIPTCTNLETFQPAARSASRSGTPTPFVLGYVGTVGGWYVFGPVLDVFERIRRIYPDACLLVINRGQHEYVRSEVQKRGIPDAALELKAVEYSRVGIEVARMDAAAFFAEPLFSNKARSPTRLGEFLGCGVPCITNAGLGDVEEVVEGERVGALLHEFTPQAVEQGVQELIRLLEEPEMARRCVAAARKWFALEDGVAAYDRIYRSLESRPRDGRGTNEWAAAR